MAALGAAFFATPVVSPLRRPQIAIVYVGEHPTGPKRPWEGLLVLPRAANTICWQPAIWPRDFLPQLLGVAGDATGAGRGPTSSAALVSAFAAACTRFGANLNLPEPFDVQAPRASERHQR